MNKILITNARYEDGVSYVFTKAATYRFKSVLAAKAFIDFCQQPFVPVLSGYRFKALKGSEVICFTNCKATAEKFGTVKQIYLRSIK